MVLKMVQSMVADIVGYASEKDVKKTFSFYDDLNMEEEDFFELLEALEAETDVELVPYSNRFETVKDLADFIEDAQ